jgi:hypothetical protein
VNPFTVIRTWQLRGLQGGRPHLELALDPAALSAGWKILAGGAAYEKADLVASLSAGDSRLAIRVRRGVPVDHIRAVALRNAARMLERSGAAVTSEADWSKTQDLFVNATVVTLARCDLSPRVWVGVGDGLGVGWEVHADSLQGQSLPAVHVTIPDDNPDKPEEPDT